MHQRIPLKRSTSSRHNEWNNNHKERTLQSYTFAKAWATIVRTGLTNFPIARLASVKYRCDFFLLLINQRKLKVWIMNFTKISVLIGVSFCKRISNV